MEAILDCNDACLHRGLRCGERGEFAGGSEHSLHLRRGRFTEQRHPRDIRASLGRRMLRPERRIFHWFSVLAGRRGVRIASQIAFTSAAAIDSEANPVPSIFSKRNDHEKQPHNPA